MFTPAMDYNQQLLAYLQTLRQLLDQWMAAMPPPPFMAPGGQFMPPTPPAPPSTASAPPTPPAPAGYAQQLFGYLQAWRQYLEQMAGTGPQAPQPSTGATDHRRGNDGGTGPLGNGPGGGNGPGSGNAPRSGASRGSDATPPPPLVLNLPPSNAGGTQLTGTTPGQTIPSLVDLPPTTYTVSQISGPGFDRGGTFGHTPTEPEVLHAPGNYFGTEAALPPRAPARLPAPQPPSGVTAAGTAFQSAIDRLDTTAVREVAPKSLFSTPGAETAHDR
ncbi:hypothetical protein [Mycobacterium terramassiliense]|uniref:Uncharacterized protein n=1 Tax=Mycobacterium terramassiliense TaxID=1841859 RepID=A0A2U3NBV4_9MYCO|nr:hypothetical protein [Mycobacterium terramassiliense]SPM28969.1 hypothetical protein K875_02084 [Mycobacterium terramassiliense]